MACRKVGHFFIMDVLDWIDKAKNFSQEDFLAAFAMEIIKDEKAVDIQREQWENDGKDYKGRIIGLYKAYTEKVSGGGKREGTPYTLRDSGDFWQNTFLNAVIKGADLEFTYNSTGIHKDELFDTIRIHGLISNPEDIFGLYDYYQNIFCKIIEPKFVNQLNKYYV